MNYICIESKGEIEVGALTLLGASTKRNSESEKIGYFGSGNKYAIAALLRHNDEFNIFSGKDEIKITSKPTTFREQSYSVIYVNNIATSLTTDMGGKFWDIAFAPIRELYSNALDEGEAKMYLTDVIVPLEGYTRIYINSSRFAEVITNRDLFFLPDNKKIYSGKLVDIYSYSNNNSIYRKGIYAGIIYDKKSSMFTYSVNTLDVNESRELSDMYTASRYIVREIFDCEDSYIVNTLHEHLQNGNTGTLEHQCLARVSSWQIDTVSKTWYDTVKKNKYCSIELSVFKDATGYLLMPRIFCEIIHKYYPDVEILDFSANAEFKECKPDTVLFDKVCDAVNILDNTSYKRRITTKKFVFGHFRSSGVLARAVPETQEVLLSIKLDTYSKEEIAKILIEEYEHLASGLSDESREFQNHLINLYYEELIKK